MEEHVYFEPKYTCDIQLKYENVYYHVHKVVLIVRSKYFRNLFGSEDQKITDGVIEFPAFTIPFEVKSRIVSSTRFSSFLHYLYNSQLQDGLLSRSKAFVLARIEYLVHYFQCEQLEIAIQCVTLVSLERDSRWPASLLLTILCEAEIFHWDGVKEKAIDKLVALSRTKAHELTESHNFRLISVDTKLLLLKRIFNLSASS